VLDYCSTQPTDKHRLEPARMGDRLQRIKEIHPNKTYDGASYADPKIGDGAGLFGYDFGNVAIAPKVYTQGNPRFPVLADQVRDNATSEKRKIKPTRPHCISNTATSAACNENPTW
jgi:hypothetical protein